MCLLQQLTATKIGRLKAMEAILRGGFSCCADVNGGNFCEGNSEAVPAQCIHTHGFKQFCGGDVGDGMDLLGRFVEGVEFDGLNDDELKLLFGVAQALHGGGELDVVAGVGGGTDEDDFVIALLEYLMVAGDVF